MENVSSDLKKYLSGNISNKFLTEVIKICFSLFLLFINWNLCLVISSGIEKWSYGRISFSGKSWIGLFSIKIESSLKIYFDSILSFVTRHNELEDLSKYFLIEYA